MWESISAVLTSSNGIQTEIIIVITFLVLLLAAKFNLISFSGKWLKIGKIKDDERTILREQINYMKAVIESQVKYLPMDKLDLYRTKYILSKVYDFFMQIIIFNHIVDSPLYIETKQIALYSMVYNMTDNEFFKTDEMQKMIYNLTETILKRLLAIRNEK